MALATGMSRRAADAVIAEQRIKVNDDFGQLGQLTHADDEVTFDGKALELPEKIVTIMLNKPAGYVSSRDGQGSRTVYDLLPSELHDLKPIGRLDKDSSGLLLLTNDGVLAQELTHPSKKKMKVYEIALDKPLATQDRETITKKGVKLEDGISKFELRSPDKNDGLKWVVTMSEGRNRQIRRTFAALGYKVTKLHRTHFGPAKLGVLKSGQYENL